MFLCIVIIIIILMTMQDSVIQTDSGSASKFLSIFIKGGGLRTLSEVTQDLIARDDMKSR